MADGLGSQVELAGSGGGKHAVKRALLFVEEEDGSLRRDAPNIGRPMGRQADDASAQRLRQVCVRHDEEERAWHLRRGRQR